MLRIQRITILWGLLLFMMSGCLAEPRIMWTSVLTSGSIPSSDKLPSFLTENPDRLNSIETEGMVRWIFFSYRTSGHGYPRTMDIPECKQGYVRFLTDPSGKNYLFIHVKFGTLTGTQWFVDQIDQAGVPCFYQKASNNSISVILTE